TLAFGGTGNGAVRLSFGGVNANADLSITDETQQISISNVGTNGTMLVSYNNQAANFAVATSGLTTQTLQNALNSIPALFDSVNNVPNTTVTGNIGGPFAITFINALTGQNIAANAFTLTFTGNAGAVVSTPTNGTGIAANGANSIQSNLSTIPALSGNI